MHVLVTGGAGFIGSHSVDALLREGAFVRVLDNFSTGKHENLLSSPHLEIMTGDIRDAAVVNQAVAGMTHVLHLAAQVSVQTSIEHPLDSHSHNITGFVTVLDAARLAGVERMVYASSAAVYGTPEKLPLEETSSTMALSPYGLEKIVNDQYAGLYDALYAFSSLGMRYFNVYGPRQDPRSPYAGVISKFVDAVRHNTELRVFGDGLQTRDFIYVEDVARANVAALKSGLAGVCNIATGHSVTLCDMIAVLEQISAKKLIIDYQPARTGDIPYSATRVERMNQQLVCHAETPLHAGLARLMDSLN